MMLVSAALLLLNLCLLNPAIVLVNGWTHTTSGGFKIVGLPGTGTQYFPESYVPNLQRWRLIQTSTRTTPTPTTTSPNHDEYPEEEAATHRLEAWTTCTANDEEEEEVSRKNQENEASTSTTGIVLVKPTMDFLIKSGQPSYVMAGLEVSTMDSPLLAQQWVSFATSVEPNFRLLLFQGASDGTDDRLAVVHAQDIRLAVERLGRVLSQSDDADLFQGFHIVSVPLVEDWIPLSVLDLSQPEGQDRDNIVVSCMLTAEPDAREIFTLDEYLVEMTATSLLQVRLNQLSSSRSTVKLHS